MKFILALSAILFCTILTAQNGANHERKTYLLEVSKFPIIKIENIGACLQEIVVIEPVLYSHRSCKIKSYSAVLTSNGVGAGRKEKCTHKQKTYYIASLLTPKTL